MVWVVPGLIEAGSDGVKVGNIGITAAGVSNGRGVFPGVMFWPVVHPVNNMITRLPKTWDIRRCLTIFRSYQGRIPHKRTSPS
jgi:hypothetical protein